MSVRNWVEHNQIRVKVAMVLIAITVVVAAVQLGMGLISMQDRMLASVKDDVAVIANVADRLVSTRLDLLKSNAIVIAKRLEGRPVEEWQGILDENISFEKDFIALTVFNRDRLVGYSGITPAPVSMLNRSRYLKKAFEGQPIISTTYWDSAVERLFMFVYVKIDDDNVLAATFPGLLFSRLVSDIKIWETGNIFMLDDRGVLISNRRTFTVIERRNNIERGRIVPEDREMGQFFETMVTSKDEYGDGFYTFNASRRYVYWRKISGSSMGWSLGVAAPLNESPINQAQRGLFSVGMVFLGVGIIVVILLSGRVARPWLQLERQNKELVMLNADVKAANEAKSTFLANMSHEMRTPMNAIIGISELMLAEDDVDKTIRDGLAKVHNAGMTLLGIINDILDISKIESGKFDLVLVEYDLPSLINDTITLNIMRISEKPIVFKLIIDDNLPSKLFGDDLRIKQICNNLLSNAFKYTRQGEVEWELTCEREGEDTVWMTSRVKDTGIGIKAEDMKRLFSDYSQLDTRSNRKIEGTGLGLVLAKRMVEMMDGHITAESEYGKGSVFTARFRQKFVTDVPIGKEIADNLRTMNYVENRLESRAKFVRMKMPYAKVLIVDDVPANLDVARGMLKPYGMMRVDCVESGQEAVDLVRKAEVLYDAIFMDHMMPEMDGVEALHIIRSKIGTTYAETVPIIVMTANAIVGNEEIFLKGGFQALVAKPIDIMLLDSVVRRWIRNRDKEAPGDPGVPVALPSVSSAVGKDSVKTLHEGIDGLNLSGCLNRFGGDEDIAMEVLESYMRSTRGILEKMRGVTEAGLTNYAIIVHGLKGSSRNVCAEAVGKQAEVLEHAAKEGNYAFVEEHNAGLIQMAEELIAQIGEYLETKTKKES